MYPNWSCIGSILSYMSYNMALLMYPTEEEEVVNDISRNLCNLQSYVYSL
jgi:hypothetical protein